MSYKAYLNSPHWQQIKKECHKKFKSCAICREQIFDIHHLTYRYIGNEDVDGHLVPLCRKHHYEFHDWLKVNPGYNESDLKQWLHQTGRGGSLKPQYRAQSKQYSSGNREKINRKWKERAQKFYNPNEPIFKMNKKAFGQLHPWNTEMLDFCGITKDVRFEKRKDLAKKIEMPMSKFLEFISHDWLLY